MQWCSEEVSEDSDAESALATPGTLQKGKIKAGSVSTRILKFFEYPLPRPPCGPLAARSTLYPGLRRRSAIGPSPFTFSLHFTSILVTFG